MSVYLYHQGYFDRSKQYEPSLAPLRALVEDEISPGWQERYNRWQVLEAEMERGYYCQWTSLLRLISEFSPEESCYRFTVEEMRTIRDRLAIAVKDPQSCLSSRINESCYWRYSLDQIRNTAQWALEIFENGLRDNVLLYLA